MIGKLWVLYDADCGFCTRAARWLLSQRRHVRLEVLPQDSPAVAEAFPGLRPRAKAELTVIDDEGGVYHGADAWLMSLWALVEYRAWAARLAAPALRPLAREAFAVVSVNRLFLSRALGLQSDAAAAEAIRAAAERGCEEGGCRTR